MKSEQEHFDIETIDRLIDQSLSDQDQTQAELHLEVCDQCRIKLTEYAGSVPWWQAASIYLSDCCEHPHPRQPESGSHGSIELNQVLTILTPSDDPRMIGRLGCYEIAGVIGSGGMGIVLKGFDISLNRYVAIKLLRPSLAASANSRLRFAREGRAAASVVHDNVIAIHGVAETSGLPYLVMPYVRGESLGTRLDRNGPFKLEEILRIGYQVSAGLAAAHGQGLIHRDVKPSNILIEAGVERLTLTDFGLARAADDVGITRSGTLAGTPEYMSPEQARGDAIDARSDLFSLGSLLWTLAAGRPPFRADSCYGVIRRIIEADPHPIRSINPSLPPWFASVVDRLMEKRADDRYQTAQQVAKLLEQSLAHVQNADAPLPAELTRARWRRLTWKQVLCVACLPLVSVGLGVGYWKTRPESPDVLIEPRSASPAETSGGQIAAAEWSDGTDATLANVRARLSRLRTETRDEILQALPLDAKE